MISLNILTYLLPAVLAYLYYSKILYPYYLGPLKNIPRGKSGLWHYLKYTYDLAVGNAATHLNMIQDYGPVVHLNDRMVLVSDPEIRKHYMSYKCPKASYYEVFDFNGPNLFSALKKDFHVSMKKLLLPAFNNKSLAAMEDTIYKVGSESLVQYIDSHLDEHPSHEFDILDLCYRNTLDVISELVFGTSINATWDMKKGKEFIDKLASTQFMLFIRYFIPFSYLIKLPMEPLLTPMILKNIHERKQNNEVHHDILQSMIDARDPETGVGLTDLEIVDECMALLFAAEDTTANTISWTLYELLKHPEVYKLVADEIIEKFPNFNEPINSQDAKKELKYLDAAILESTRKNPAGADIIPRDVPEGGLTINGHYLPPKTVFTIDIYTEHNDPKFWGNPKEYDINRWFGEDREAKKAKLAGFGLGPRSCIGRDLAMNEIFLVLANLIRHFNFEMVDKELEPVNYFILKPKSNCFKVKISRRS